MIVQYCKDNDLNGLKKVLKTNTYDIHERYNDDIGLTWCCHNNNYESAKMLLEHNFDVNYCDSDGTSPLMQACISTNNIKLLRLLLSYGANIDATNSWNWTALLYACVENNPKMIKELLPLNPNIDIVNNSKMSPLSLACNGEMNETVKLLLSYGCDTTIKDKEGKIFQDYKYKIPVKYRNEGFLNGGLLMYCIRCIKANISKFKENDLMNKLNKDTRKYLKHYINNFF